MSRPRMMLRANPSWKRRGCLTSLLANDGLGEGAAQGGEWPHNTACKPNKGRRNSRASASALHNHQDVSHRQLAADIV